MDAKSKKAIINLGISEEVLQRYLLLLKKRDREQLTSDEHEELITISDEIELANAERVRKLVESGLITMDYKKRLRKID
jgi:hypothetical protein